MVQLREVALDDKYTVGAGRIFVTGIQALVRLPLVQRQRDLAAGLSTAGFVTGYRGSPLGAYDQQLERARAHLDAHHIVHWTAHGPTTLANLELRCRRHHILQHQRDLRAALAHRRHE